LRRTETADRRLRGLAAPAAVATVVAALALVAILPGCAPRGRDFRFVRLSGPMPPIAGATLDGHSLVPSDYRGRVVLVNFWASWCAPCRREQAGLQDLWRRLGPTGRVSFIGIDYRDAGGAARSYLREFGVTYPSLADPTGALGARFGVPFLPATILVDARGGLRYRLVGAQKAGFVAGLIDTIREFEPASPA
jgi:thiol-disulfide isomerase/thioredoxin